MTYAESDVLTLLRRSVSEAGSITNWARAHGVSKAWVSNVMRGRAAIGLQIGLALGLRREMVWRPAK